jgi:capsular exopolysaccharide synthesis family protein
MTPQPSTRSPGEERGVRYLTAIAEHWLLILVLCTIAVAVAGVYSFNADKRYEAQADLLFTPIPTSNDELAGVSIIRASGDANRDLITVARLMGSAPGSVYREAYQRARTDGSAKIEVDPVSQSSIISISTSASSPQVAADLANAFAESSLAFRTEQFQEELQRAIERLRSQLERIPADERPDSTEAEGIEQRLAELAPFVGASDPTLELVSPATPPQSAVWPKPVLSMTIAFIAALFLGIGTAVTLEVATPRVKREEEVLLGHRLPILARIPRVPAKVIRAYLTGRGELPAGVWEAYRTLRASLANAGPEGEFPRTILVTSAEPREGKTMTSVNLAITLASAGLEVILVDGDLRRPMIAPVFGVPAGRNGLAHLISGKVKPEQLLVPAPGFGENLRLLPASPEHALLIDLLEAGRAERALDQLRELADVVLVDSPPVTEVADALALADAADAVLVTVRLGHSRRDRVSELQEMLANRGIVPTGAVVTVRERSRAYRYYSYSGVPPKDAMLAQSPAEAVETAEPNGRPAQTRLQGTSPREESLTRAEQRRPTG